MNRLIARWLPSAPIVHPWLNQRFKVTTTGKSPGAVVLHAGICAEAARVFMDEGRTYATLMSAAR
jgi:hypothetical protein